jgi:hypothetical protein
MTANYRQKYSVRIKRISGSDIVKKKRGKKKKREKNREDRISIKGIKNL